MNSEKVLVGVIVGAVAGLALGILFAPAKGVDLRKNLSKKGEDFLDNLKKRVEDTLVNATNELEYLKGEADELLDKGKEKVQNIKNDIEYASNSIGKTHY